MSKLLVDITPFSITPKQLNESMTKHNGRLIVEGVLQRAESENQMVEYTHQVFSNEKWISTKVERLKKIEHMVS